MNNTAKFIIVAIIFFCGIVIGNLGTFSVSAAPTGTFQNPGSSDRNNASLNSDPDGWSVRALSNLFIDLVQASNGDGEPKHARAEAREVISLLKNLSLSGSDKHQNYERVSRLFAELEIYTAKRKQDRNTRESCKAAARLFKSLSIMENESVSEKTQEKEAAKFFYALADISELERTDKPIDISTKGREELFRSLGDICKAEGNDSDKEGKQAIAKMFRAIGTLATEEK